MTEELEKVSEYEDGAIPQTNGGDTIEDRKRRDREAVTSLPGRGLTPDTYGKFVTMANDICRPDNIGIKAELRSNRAVVVGLIEIAMRARWSIYMLNLHTYVIKGVLCFDAQVFHALARPFLDGGLKGEYAGEGEERQIIIRGKLKGDPYEYEHRSPTVKKLHPGYSSREINGEVVKQIKGSPLWDRKPDVQLWYDTTRDWVRMHCPEATMGCYTRDEVEAEDWKDVTPPKPTLGERLAASERPEPREGFRPVEIAEIIEAAAPPAVLEHEREQKGRAGVRKPAATKTRQRAPEPRETPSRRKPKAAAGLQPPKEAAADDPKWRTYVKYAEDWIADAADAETAVQQWEAEFEQRNEVGVPVSERNRLRALWEEKVDKLRVAE